MKYFVLLLAAVSSYCPTYSCITDYDPILDEGECAQFYHNALNRTQDRYLFNKTLCPEGFRCPYELLSSTQTSVNCTRSIVNDTSMANIIDLSFGIKYNKLLPGESCTHGIECYSLNCLTTGVCFGSEKSAACSTDIDCGVGLFC